MDTVVGNARTIVDIALQIKKAADTVRYNRKDCVDIARFVDRNSALLKRLEEETEITKSEPMRNALEDVAESLREALKLVTECQQRHIISRFFGAGDMATDLSRVKEDLVRKLMQASWATNIHGTIIMTNFFKYAAELVEEPKPQKAGVVKVSDSSHATGGASSLLSNLNEVNDEEEESMVSSGREPRSAHASGLRQFRLSELKAATDDFSEDNIVGSGAYSTVYKGVLHDGLEVAIKKLHSIPRPHALLIHEFNINTMLQHQNVVKLVGYCIHSEVSLIRHNDQYVEVQTRKEFLVLGYVPNGSLDMITEGKRHIDWSSCFRIIQGIVQGLHYIHQQRVLHMNLKEANILLDSDMNPVIIGFGLSRVLDRENSEVILDVMMGTVGYMPPEQYDKGMVSTKSDIYALGVILLKTIGSVCTGSSDKWILLHDEKAGGVEALLDRTLQLDESQVMEVTRCVQVAKLCTEYDWTDRPTAGDVLQMLKAEKELPTPKNPHLNTSDQVKLKRCMKVASACIPKCGKRFLCSNCRRILAHTSVKESLCSYCRGGSS